MTAYAMSVPEMPAAHRLAEAGDRAGAESLIRNANLSDADKGKMIARLGAKPSPFGRTGRDFAKTGLPSEKDTFASVDH